MPLFLKELSRLYDGIKNVTPIFSEKQRHRSMERSASDHGNLSLATMGQPVPNSYLPEGLAVF